eukprot:3157688-Amphidinium_carterae.1
MVRANLGYGAAPPAVRIAGNEVLVLSDQQKSLTSREIQILVSLLNRVHCLAGIRCAATAGLGGAVGAACMSLNASRVSLPRWQYLIILGRSVEDGIQAMAGFPSSAELANLIEKIAKLWPDDSAWARGLGSALSCTFGKRRVTAGGGASRGAAPAGGASAVFVAMNGEIQGTGSFLDSDTRVIDSTC